MVLVFRPLLEQKAAVVVKNKDGERTVQPSFFVRTKLVGSAERLVVFSNQYDGRELGHDLEGLWKTRERVYSITKMEARKILFCRGLDKLRIYFKGSGL